MHELKMNCKRKPLRPVRFDAAKMRKLSWNSFDGIDLSSSAKRDLNLAPEKEILEEEDLQTTNESELSKSISFRKARKKLVTDEKLQRLINKCDFYLTVLKEFPKQQNLLGVVGKFYIWPSEPSATLSVFFRHMAHNANKFWFYVDKSNGDHFVFVKMSDLSELFLVEDTEHPSMSDGTSKKRTDKNIYFNIKCSLSPEVLSSLQPKDVVLRKSLAEDEEGAFWIEVCLTEAVIFNHLRDVSLRRINSDLQVIMSHFCGTRRPEVQRKRQLMAKSDDLDDLYAEIQKRKVPAASSSFRGTQPDNLRPLLRDYQKAAVRWMLEKEGAWEDQRGDEDGHFDSSTFYEELKLYDGTPVHFNASMGILCRERPIMNRASLGGILADEMGLGKTVEVLACILLNPRVNLPPLTKLPTLQLKDRKTINATKKQSQKSPKKKQYVLKHGAVVKKSSSAEQVASSSSSSSSPSSSSPCFPLSPPPSSSSSSSFPPCLDGSESSQMPNTLEHSYAKVSKHASPSKSPKSKKQKDPVETKSALGDIDGLNHFPFLGVREPEVSSGDGRAKGESEKAAECICGGENFEEKKKSKNGNLDKIVVTCQKCGSGQHAGCVNYDLGDPFRGCYLCPHCHVAEIPVPSGATLIVAPSSILHQWIDEILKHVSNDALKIFVYSGVHKQGFVQPMTLSRQDIVMTTYETLRKEVDYVDLPHTSSEGLRKFRFPKRFMAIPSPIVAVEWWRICLDEAQMVECTTTKTADMASRLTCINRWCVTGTPVQRGIDDLYGLFSFLRVAPFQLKIFWSRLLYEPYCSGRPGPLYDAVSKVLWRTSKKDVIDQIQLPEQSNEMHLLTFTPVEDHFYRRLYEDCSLEATQKLSKLTGIDVKLNSLDKTTLGQLLHPLLKLRQACCHPQAVRGEFFSINKSTMTMTDLLDQLIKKVRLECEEAQRQIVMATNGLAGWFILKEDYSSAIQEYRSIISLAGEAEGKVRVDPLQLIHAVYNLQEVMTLCPPGVRGHTLRDSELPKMEKELAEKYMRRRIDFVSKTKESWMAQKNSVTNIEMQMKKGQDWWSELLLWVEACGLDVQLIEKVKVDLSDNAQMMDLMSQFRDIRGLQYVLFDNLDKLKNTRTSLVDLLQSIDKISSVISSSSPLPSSSSTSSSTSSPVKSVVLFSSPELNNLVSQTMLCCLRPGVPTKEKCPFCKSHKMFEIYESNLFNFNDKGFIDQSQDMAEKGQDEVAGSSVKRHGNWSDNDVERTFKNIIAVAQKFSGDKELIDVGLKHLKLFEALKKEFKVLRVYWQALREQISSIDEITMATMRLRLREEFEEISDPPQPHIIDARMLDSQKQKLVSDRVVGQHLLKKKKSQLQYLRGLLETHSSMERGINPEPCPICQNKLGQKWSVLQCGHCFCLRCMRVLANETCRHPVPQQNHHRHHSRNGHSIAFRTLMCPVCRQVTSLSDVSYVSTEATSDSGSMKRNDKYFDPNIKVKGEWSTKIDGMIRVLLCIIRDDPAVKVLIFSTWQDVLELLSKALAENSITFCSLANHYKFEENLHHYKEDATIRCLLLPVHSGSNGLNLTESTHVLLVEPVLNPAQELQAIGRVHRIGQTKPTFVHRFLVKGTIEEKLHSLLSTVEVPTEWRNSEETTLTIGEFSDLFSSLPSDHLEEDDDDGPQNTSRDEQDGDDEDDGEGTSDFRSLANELPATDTFNQSAHYKNAGGSQSDSPLGLPS